MSRASSPAAQSTATFTPKADKAFCKSPISITTETLVAHLIVSERLSTITHAPSLIDDLSDRHRDLGSSLGASLENTALHAAAFVGAVTREGIQFEEASICLCSTVLRYFV